ncbi:MFS transporter [Phytoactinopolyspora halotolerans]|uniref:MFS transporter n=1 Tax=Phytoactinopolyspora halotolerans TaxID=1981512 RepID=A0A6L9SC93_9ACTN|nr:MFS transporter [Phytoactinopolyspora halotolerans]NEE02629.1 MFS transporter [Phytoactinopolyspora halotolerans]
MSANVNTIPPVPHRWRVMFLLAAAFFMTILDSTIVVTALPSIGADLALNATGLQWIVTGYVIAYGGLLLFCGRAADLLGRTQLFIAGNALWVLSSMLCGLAPSGEVLIAGRVLQGLAAAVIAPAALSIVMITFPQGPERNKALGIWGGLGGVGATAGLLLGGVLTDGLGWPWIFFVNVPVAVAVLVLSPRLLPRGPLAARSRRRFDAVGAFGLTAALALVVYAVTTVPERGWFDARVAGPFLAAAILGALFVAVENRSPAPLVPFRILRSRVLVGGNLLIFTAGMAVDGMLITLTAHVQRVLGWSALQFGLLAAVMTVTSVLGVMYGQHAVSRSGFRPVGACGGALLAAACLLLTLVRADDARLGVMVAALLVFGAGMGAAFVSSQIAALTGVAEENSGLAAGLVDTSFNIGTGLGVAIATSVALARSGAGEVGASAEALADGYRAAFGAAAAFAALGVVVALYMFRRTSPGPDDDASHADPGCAAGHDDTSRAAGHDDTSRAAGHDDTSRAASLEG